VCSGDALDDDDGAVVKVLVRAPEVKSMLVEPGMAVCCVGPAGPLEGELAAAMEGKNATEEQH